MKKKYATVVLLVHVVITAIVQLITNVMITVLVVEAATVNLVHVETTVTVQLITNVVSLVLAANLINKNREIYSYFN